MPDDISAGNGWHWDQRGWLAVDGAGATLENVIVPGNIDITASGVTVQNVRVLTSGDTFGISLRHVSHTTIQDTQIYAKDGGANRLLVGVKDIYGDSVDTQVLRCDISRVATGVQIYQGTIKDNYIHDMGYHDGDHTNGTTSNGGTGKLMIQHNTIFNQNSQTDAISLFQDFGVEANRLIDNNLIAGGGYTVYGGANPGAAKTSNIQITNNRFSKIFYPNSGSFGHATAFDPSGAGNAWTGNVWDETGKPLSYQ